MEEATFVSANSPGGVGGFQISYTPSLRSSSLPPWKVSVRGGRISGDENFASSLTTLPYAGYTR